MELRHQGAPRRSAARLLELEGFDVIGKAATGADGIESVERLRPAPALVDVALLDISGFDVADRVAAATPVILVSSRDRADVAGRLERSGALGFVAKDLLSGPPLTAVLEGRA